MNNNFKLIREFSNEILSESVISESGNKKWVIQGVTLQADIQNKNKRTYPKNVLSEAIKKHKNEFMSTSRALGELNHPTDGMSSIDLKNVSHKFIEVIEDGSNYITKAEILDTPNGKIVQNLLEGGVQLGISSRGLGSVKNTKSGVLVENLYLVSLGDIVADPSAPGAFVSGILESVEFQMIENDQGTSFIQTKMDEYSQLIKEAKREEIDAAVKQIFSDYLKNFQSNK